jgi:alpha-1,2-glucosyltransferase
MADGRPRNPLRSLRTVFIVFHLVAFAVISQVAPDPYIDEIFHIPQVKAYCTGDFAQWDDKITTPPGLYATCIVDAELIRGTSFRTCFSRLVRS